MKKLFLVVLIAFCVINLLWVNNSDLKAHADTAEYFEAELYTNNDNLLNYDGSINTQKSITDFALEVKTILIK